MDDADLRPRLKRWEHEWRVSHGGCNPSKEDIRANLAIRKLYKRYKLVRSQELVKEVQKTPQKTERVIGLFESLESRRVAIGKSLLSHESPSKAAKSPKLETPDKAQTRVHEITPLYLRHQTLAMSTPPVLEKKRKDLSTILRELRDMEDKAVDDEEQILQCMEDEDVSKNRSGELSGWKKKGQKRSTKRVKSNTWHILQTNVSETSFSQ